MASQDPSKEGSKSLVSVLEEYGYKPLTKNNILYYYSPLLGAGSYTLLSVNVMNPSLVIRWVVQLEIKCFTSNNINVEVCSTVCFMFAGFFQREI